MHCTISSLALRRSAIIHRLPYNSSRVNGFKQGELSETLLSMVTRKQKESDIRFG